MVEFTCDPVLGLLYVKLSGSNFLDLLETVKDFRAKYDPKTKLWSTSIAKYKDLEKELLYAGGKEETVEISEYTQRQIDSYMRNLKELKVCRPPLVYKPELMKHGPLIGKHPFENFQMEDFLQALNKNRFLFAWEMGLGKSWALTALIEHLRFYNKIGKCLIFSSGIGVWNVKSELIKFGVNQHADDIRVITSAADLKYEDRDIFNSDKYPESTLIMPYDLLKVISNFYYDKEKGTSKNPKPSNKTAYKSSPLPLKEWAGGKPLGLFLDENHLLGNPTSRRTEIMMMNLPFFDYRYEFTGTLADVYQKLYSSCKILDKDLIDGQSYTDWLSSYNDIGNKFSKYAVNPDGWNMEKLGVLNEKLRTLYGSKRDKKDCLDLPLQYTIPPIFIEMSEKQKEIYRMFSNESAAIFQKEADEKGVSFSDKMSNMFAFFQMGCDNPEVLLDSSRYNDFTPELKKKINAFSYEKDYKKLECVDAIINERIDEENEPGILWCYHPRTIMSLAKKYAKYNPTVITREMSKDERFAAIEAFKKNKGKLLISSILLINSSITVNECKWMCYVERCYNYSDYSQSTARNFRPGQTETTRIYHICYDNTIDVLQMRNLETKGATLASLFSKNFVSTTMWRQIFNMNKEMPANF